MGMRAGLGREDGRGERDGGGGGGGGGGRGLGEWVQVGVMLVVSDLVALVMGLKGREHVGNGWAGME